MKIERTALAAKLAIVAPALATKDLIEDLCQLWFFGDSVVAYNDIIGIDVALRSEFKGGVRGSLLIGLLDKSRAKEITIEVDDNDQVTFKAAGAKLSLARFRPEAAPWRFPDFNEKAAFKVDETFVKAINRALISVGGDSAIPDQLGVTILAEEDGWLNFYSTNDKSLLWIGMKEPKGWDVKRLIVPQSFCEQFVRLCKDGGDLLVTDDSIMAQNAAGTRLYSRLVDSQRPLDFGRVISGSLPKDYKYKNLIPIPTRLALALDRIAVVMVGKGAEPIDVDIEGDTLRLAGKTERAEIKDLLRLEENHPTVRMRIDPVPVRRALEYCDRMLFTERVLIMAGPDGLVYLVSAFASRPE